jgi:CheY-like chemotaxis protein
MNGILGMAELMTRTPLSPEQRDYAETIRQSGKALLELINDILDLAKVEAGKMQLHAEPFEPLELLGDIARLFRARAIEKGLELRVEAPAGGEVMAVGDALRVRQILANLAGNAVKFTERGSVTLRLETVPENGGRIGLRYSVMDTGVGIAAANLPTVFEVFTQLHNAAAGKFGGSGLGLAISQRLAQVMGGRIAVASELGRGSTFTFSVALPAADASGVVRQAVTEPAVSRHIAARVLVVEDNPVNQKLVRLMLERLGCGCDVASSGPEALSLAATRDYDLVLMDWQMPEMDGLEAARRLKELWTPERQAPIIAVTASAMQGDREACLVAGMSDYLAKPIEMAGLASVLERWTRGNVAK